MNTNRTAEKLKELRGARSLREVSSAVGISISALGMYETGKRIPRDNIKLRIANFYGRSIEDIFFREKYHNLCILTHNKFTNRKIASKLYVRKEITRWKME